MRDIKDIKFRAKPMSNHPSYPKWVFGLIQSIAKDGTGFLREEHKNCIHIKANTIGQFTGLYDKNGIEIYEGDIITCSNGMCNQYIIKFLDGCFMGYDDNTTFAKLLKDMRNPQVIGNIYDNTDLLENKSLPITYKV